MTHELKVKALSLQEEARVIKKEEARALRLQRRYQHSQYRNRLLLNAKAKAEAEGRDADEAQIWADVAANKSFQTYRSLREHRIGIVRTVARATNIARGFLKGLPYRAIETFPKKVGNKQVDYLLSQKTQYNSGGYHNWNGPDWDKVTAMVQKYGNKDDQVRYADWLKAIGLVLNAEEIPEKDKVYRVVAAT